MTARGSTLKPCSYFHEIGMGVPALFNVVSNAAMITEDGGVNDCTCKQGPTEAVFVALFNELYRNATRDDASAFPLPLGIEQTLDVTQVDYVRTCNRTNTTLFNTAPKEFLENDPRVIERRLLEAYNNQANF
jgi:hypothetical protein